MGWGSRKINNLSEYQKYLSPGYFWMPVLEGTHLSYDFVLIKGVIKLFICFQGYPTKDGMFDYWETQNKSLPPEFLFPVLRQIIRNPPVKSRVALDCESLHLTTQLANSLIQIKERILQLP